MFVEVTLDRPRHLRFDVAALDKLEQALGGQPLGEIVGRLDKFSVTALITACWIGLRHEERSLSRDRVAKLIQDFFDGGGTFVTLVELVAKALNESGVWYRDQTVGTGDEGNGKREAETS